MNGEYGFREQKVVGVYGQPVIAELGGIYTDGDSHIAEYTAADEEYVWLLEDIREDGDAYHKIVGLNGETVCSEITAEHERVK